MNSPEQEELLEEHKYVDMYQQDDVPFKDLSQAVVRKCLYIGLMIFIFAITSTFLIKIPREVSLTFELRGNVREVIYQYPEKTYLLHAYVNTGDTVFTGKPLVTITSEKIVTLLQNVEESKRALDLYSSIKRVANEKAIELIKMKQKGARDRLTLVEKEAALHEKVAANELGNLHKQVSNRRKQYERDQTLHGDRIVPDLVLESSLMDFLKAEQLYLFTEREYVETNMSIANQRLLLKNELELLESELENTVIKDNLEAAELQQRYDLAMRRLDLHYGPSKIEGSRLTLLSPADGIVTMRIENESEVAPQQYLLRLQTAHSEPYAYALSSSAQLGHLKRGKKAVLKYDAYPHYYYGTMVAVIDSVSTSPSADGKYPIRLSIVEHNKLLGKVTNGMRGVASVTVEEKSVMRYVFKSFLKNTTIE